MITKIQYALSIVAALLLVGCSQEDLSADRQPESSKIQFYLADETPVSRSETANNASGQLVTTFQTGDVAGLYVVSGGVVKYDNLKLTKNDYGFWESEILLSASDLTGAQFYAYYPYTELASFDVSAAKPFKAMTDARKPGSDQSFLQGYEQADIMVTDACTLDATTNSVSLTLKHQKAMVFMELPCKLYNFTNEGLEPYLLENSEEAVFTMDGEAIQPYLHRMSRSYRFIVEPGETKKIEVTYTYKSTTSSDTKKTATINVAALSEGKYHCYKVDGGAKVLSDGWTLEVGDYYCADGTLVKKNTAKSDLPSNVMGIIYQIGTTDRIATENADWSHAVVVSLKEIKAKWGNDKTTTTEQNNAGWKYWYRNYGLADQNGKTSAAQLDESLMIEEGYEVTKTWRAVPEPLTIGGFTLDYTSIMNSTLDNWIDTYSLPVGITTGWFIPSLGDWKALEQQKATIDQQLSTAGGTALSTAQYWSCNVRAAGSNWCYVLNKTALADRYKGVACNSSVNYRFLLAF